MVLLLPLLLVLPKMLSSAELALGFGLAFSPPSTDLAWTRRASFMPDDADGAVVLRCALRRKTDRRCPIGKPLSDFEGVRRGGLLSLLLALSSLLLLPELTPDLLLLAIGKPISSVVSRLVFSLFLSCTNANEASYSFLRPLVSLNI